jgi:hypothetical protein
MKKRLHIEIAADVDPVAALEALVAALTAGTLILDRPHAVVGGARLDPNPGELVQRFRGTTRIMRPYRSCKSKYE